MKQTAGTFPAIPSDEVVAANLDEQIRKRAYENYEQNGKRDGFAEQDWYQAEAEIQSSATLKAAA